jgi:phosphatidylglycerol:prolipoprotein diacylglycerol transferase
MKAVIPFPEPNPELVSFTLFGMEFALRWYALAYIAGLLIAWRILVVLVRRDSLWPGGRPPMKPAQVEDLVTWLILGVVIGGRLGFVLFYKPAFYLSHPMQIFAVWEGGMSFHGGFLGVVAAAWIFTSRHAIPKLSAADALAVATPPGLFLPLAGAWFYYGDELPRHPSQLYEATLEGLVLGTLLLFLALRRDALKRPGLLTGLFLSGYGAARFAVELFRQPDSQFVSPGNPEGFVIGEGAIGLTMGQLLSLPMIALGLAFVIFALRRRPVPA